jgi:hypothetical protein
LTIDDFLIFDWKRKAEDLEAKGIRHSALWALGFSTTNGHEYRGDWAAMMD